MERLCSWPSVWTGRALQVRFEDLEAIGLALLYPALEWNVCVPGHLYGPVVRCKSDFRIWMRLVLRFCIRPLNGTFVFLAICMDRSCVASQILGFGCDWSCASVSGP